MTAAELSDVDLRAISRALAAVRAAGPKVATAPGDPRDRPATVVTPQLVRAIAEAEFRYLNDPEEVAAIFLSSLTVGGVPFAEWEADPAVLSPRRREPPSRA